MLPKPRLTQSGHQLRTQLLRTQLKDRLHNSVPPTRQKVAQPRLVASPRSSARPNGTPPTIRWDKTRIALAQQVWGKGFIAPGGKAATLELVEPLGLERRMRVLDLGAGLGGTARIMARRFGAQVTGLEPDRHLATAGMALSRWACLANRAAIHPLASHAEALEPASFDRILTKDVLFTVRDKERLLRLITALLAHGGRMLLVDYAVAGRVGNPAALDHWIEAEPTRPVPWSVEDYIKILTQLGLNLRVDDLSQQTHLAITRSWTGYIDRARRAGVTAAARPTLEHEFELWRRRARLLKAGDLRVCRILAQRDSQG